MIHVTDRAREQFRRTLAAIAGSRPDHRLRLDRTASGQLGLFKDTEHDEDQVVEHDGAPILLISSDVSRALDGRTIDVTDGDDGPRFIVRR